MARPLAKACEEETRRQVCGVRVKGEGGVDKGAQQKNERGSVAAQLSFWLCWISESRKLEINLPYSLYSVIWGNALERVPASAASLSSSHSILPSALTQQVASVPGNKFLARRQRSDRIGFELCSIRWSCQCALANLRPCPFHNDTGGGARPRFPESCLALMQIESPPYPWISLFLEFLIFSVVCDSSLFYSLPPIFIFQVHL